MLQRTESYENGFAIFSWVVVVGSKGHVWEVAVAVQTFIATTGTIVGDM